MLSLDNSILKFCLIEHDLFNKQVTISNLNLDMCIQRTTQYDPIKLSNKHEVGLLLLL